MKGNEPTWACSVQLLIPHARGVKIAKIAIAPKHGMQLFCPFGTYLDVFLCGINALPALSHLHFLPREMWMLFHPFLAPPFGISVSTVWCFTHAFPTSFIVD